MPWNEPLELGARLETAIGLDLDAIVVNGLYPERFTGKEAGELRAHANGNAAVRAALTEHEVDMERGVVKCRDREVWVRAYPLPIDWRAGPSVAERDSVRDFGEKLLRPRREVSVLRGHRADLS